MSSTAVRAERVSFSFADRALLDDATFHLARGWTGLVGANGSGKSTLLRLITGALKPTSGALRVPPSVVLCTQEVDALDAGVRDFAGADDGLARRLHGRLGLDAAMLARWATMSPGERKRWQVGAALWREPEVLLLDEPTNHLDAGAARWLRDALADFRGVGVLVSHDRALLDEVTSATLRLDGGTARLWPGAFSVAQAAWRAEDEQALDAQRETKRRLESEERRLDASRRRHEASTRSRNAGARMKSAKDADARGLGANYRVETAERAHAAALRRSVAKSDEVRERLAAITVRDEAGRDLFLRDEPCPRSVIARFAGDLPHPASSEPLLRALSLTVRRGQHVVLAGRNGAGKSTLLRALVVAAALPEERVLVLPQELTPQDVEHDLAVLHDLPRDERGRVLQLVHALGVEPDVLLTTTSPSPGEARKLRLALGLGRSAWLAVLDEPTNHLDLPSIERLEEALATFPGALLLVTHDSQLAAKVATTRWLVADGTVREQASGW
ncbi:MAG: ABC-F family ATP-binding cassette domain-containing protein [Myxococcaceae bacterium]|nr:ABC-F family ATP-binding cassette domain-containing protein [Myxococcaceae bacterium]